MFTKEEASRFKTEFWTAFGVIMKPHFSASGFRINWINYKTGLKDIVFKFDADKKSTSIAIQLKHKDDGIRALYWEQFLEFKTLFQSIMEEEWIWDDNLIDKFGSSYSSISIRIDGNIFDQDKWQNMFAFLKPRLIKLDEFWDDGQEMFKSL